MKIEEQTTWQKIRQKGQLKFILINGMLSWGLPMFAVMTFVFNEPTNENGIRFGFIAVSMGIWAIAGLLFGKLIWLITERRYQKALLQVAKSEAEAEPNPKAKAKTKIKSESESESEHNKT